MVIFREQKKHTKDTGQGNLWREALSLAQEHAGDRGLGECFNKSEEVEGIFENSDEIKVGFAVDIGTTTVVITALDLKEKKVIGTISQTNEQTKLGADVMMRIMHCMSGRQEKLHQFIVQQVEKMAEQLLEKAKEDKEKILMEQCCFFIVGNTTMCHLFLDKSVEGLAGYPFRAAYQGNYQCIGKEIGMELFSPSKICVLSGVAAHVGSDALAVIGAEGLYQKDKVQLAVDLGTNAEIILNRKGKISVCSTAAGPAFEGKGIACGMSAKGGAITEVKIAANNGNIILGVIEGAGARGICSSGLVDLLAQLRKCRILLKDGYLLGQSEAAARGIPIELCKRLVLRKDQHAFLLCEEGENTKEVYLLQSDIRNLQLAKAAIQAGILSILAETELSIGDIDEFIVAGVLGSCVRTASGVSIGLFPAAVTERLKFAGNAAGKGAALGMIDPSFSKRMEMLAQEISHIEIAQMADFQGRLMGAMDLKQWL